jgi:hypothetical protein
LKFGTTKVAIRVESLKLLLEAMRINSAEVNERIEGKELVLAYEGSDTMNSFMRERF